MIWYASGFDLPAALLADLFEQPTTLTAPIVA
jgi:hypothetical protein